MKEENGWLSLLNYLQVAYSILMCLWPQFHSQQEQLNLLLTAILDILVLVEVFGIESLPRFSFDRSIHIACCTR